VVGCEERSVDRVVDLLPPCDNSLLLTSRLLGVLAYCDYSFVAINRV
jgi:hypothetical protein